MSGRAGSKRAAPAFPLPLERLQPARSDAPRARIRGVGIGEAPRGHGLDSAAARERMVQRLRAEGLHDPAVLAALAQVPRHAFIDAGLAAQAYEDTSLPIGLGQTISKPSVVARMLALLGAGAKARASGSLGRVLEIGTGCGYQAALLARLSRGVYSIERLKDLHDKAREHLAGLREHRIRLIYGDGRLGHAPNAPYDSIVAAAGGDDLPPAWLEQLAPGGRLVAPKSDAQRGLQLLVVVDRTRDGYVHSYGESVRFVPLKSGLD